MMLKKLKISKKRFGLRFKKTIKNCIKKIPRKKKNTKKKMIINRKKTIPIHMRTLKTEWIPTFGVNGCKMRENIRYIDRNTENH